MTRGQRTRGGCGALRLLLLLLLAPPLPLLCEGPEFEVPDAKNARLGRTAHESALASITDALAHGCHRRRWSPAADCAAPARVPLT